MGGLLHVVTHPEVRVEPAVPVPQWGLSEAGVRRLDGLLALPWVPRVGHVVSSAEVKAMQTAQALAGARGLAVEVVPELGENDRSATGFLPPEEFEVVADAFFREPARSVRGWETASAAQERVVSAVQACLLRSPAPGDLAVVAHGAVGTLLWCALSGCPIDRRHDQPGQGSWYSVDLGTLRPLSGWQRVPVT